MADPKTQIQHNSYQRQEGLWPLVFVGEQRGGVQPVHIRVGPGWCFIPVKVLHRLVDTGQIFSELQTAGDWKTYLVFWLVFDANYD